MSCEVVEKIGTGDCELEKIFGSNRTFANILASELVAEILENALDIVEEVDDIKTTKIAGDIMDKLSTKFQELKLSEDAGIVDKVAYNPLKGLGDQLKGDDIISSDAVKHPPVEKKSRLTDLVKNSKQMLSRLILNENKDTNHDTKHEKLLKVVDLDSGKRPFRITRRIPPESVPLPRNDSNEILEEPEEDEKMDEIQLCCSPDRNVHTTVETCMKTMTFPLAGSSEKRLSLVARYRTLKFPSELKKKKWNIGSKIINYIKKKQTSKRDDTEKPISDGIEITPQRDDA